MNRRHTLMLTVAGAALAALLAAVLLGVKVAAAGWLIAFFYVGAISLGSLALLLIHRLTGGHWGDALRPLLEPAAACIPLLAVLFVPVLIATPLLYPWFEGAGDVKPDVAALYLNMPLFVVRAVISFVGWSVLALALSRIGGRAGTLLAAVGLIFYAVTISLVSVDWVLSGEPVFISTSFGASVAIMQLLAALAFAAMVAPLPDEQAVRDLAGLMLAVTLGLTYIDFMAVLVIWYGDLPKKIDWFVRRDSVLWMAMASLAFLVGSLLPVLALLLTRVRGSRRALRAVGASILIGLALYDAYLLAPLYGVWTLLTALLALIVQAGALVLLADARWPSLLFHRVRAAHD